MLTNQQRKYWFYGLFIALTIIQLYSAFKHQLFGDEAFYWLESQYLSWSYAELPAWTQWAIATSQWLLPKTEFSIRLPGLLAAWCLPWLGILISSKLQSNQPDQWQTGLLLLTLPLLCVAGILAIPDIWLILFGMIAIYLLIMALQSDHFKWFIFLGLCLAFGINVHVRFWIIVFLASIIIFWQYRKNLPFLKKLIIITLPVMLMGFLPILIFNIQADFPLLNFQLSNRHPWQFQPEHFKFFVIQVIVTTPFVFLLCFKQVMNFKQLSPVQQTITLIAATHWLFYALMGFFSDNLRFNLHWTLFSYVLVLIVAGSINNHSKLKFWSTITGIAVSFVTLFALFYSLHFTTPSSQSSAKVTENARGWIELASKTDQIMTSQRLTRIVTDNFMTLAELAFYLPNNPNLSVLSHPANIKHGREIQLAIMDLKHSNSTSNELLVVEQTALKLDQSVDFYQKACQKLNGIELIDHLDYGNGIKSFYFFKTGTGHCRLPPLIHIELDNDQMIGWVLVNKSTTVEFSIQTGDSNMNVESVATSLGENELFIDLNPDLYNLQVINSQIIKSNYHQLVIKYPTLTIRSSRIYLH